MTAEVETAAIFNTHLRDNLSFLYTPPTCQVSDASFSHNSSGNWLSVDYATENWDTDTIHDNATNNTRLTAKTAGRYQVFAFGQWDTNTTGDRFLRIRKNGATVNLLEERVTPTANGNPHILAGELALAVNDYIELQAWQNSGGTRTFDNSVFSMTWRSN